MPRFDHIRQHLQGDALRAWDAGIDLSSRTFIRDMTAGRDLPGVFHDHVETLSGERLESLFLTVRTCFKSGEWTEFEGEIAWMR
jgi:hypothetical protein